jgi:hypothetical protein
MAQSQLNRTRFFWLLNNEGGKIKQPIGSKTEDIEEKENLKLKGVRDWTRLNRAFGTFPSSYL